MNETEKISILLVDDRPENLLALENLLESPDLNILKATSGNEALSFMLEYDLALVLLDVQMPDMDGFETASLMRGSDKTKQVPIIFVTAISKEQEHIFKGYEAGAVDYIFKPLDPHILKSKVNVFLDLYKQKKLLERNSHDLKQTVEELKRANEKIVEQQKSVIEDERLKVLLQMAGATAHELNQPLMGLLGNIELMRKNKDRPEKLARYMASVEKAGQRISDIVTKIQNVRHDVTKPYTQDTSIIDLHQKINVLSVYSSGGDFETIKATLKDNNQIRLSWATGIEQAMQLLAQGQFDLIFLDYLLPDGDGFDFLRRIDEEGLEIPVVVITGQGDEMIASQVIQAGAYDYLPMEKASDKYLSIIAANALEKARLRREIKVAHKKMAEMSTKDELTGLYNRRYFMEALEHEMSRAKRYETDLALGMMDLDHFKRVNDAYGHSAGDMVLSEVGNMLEKCIRHSDIACRYGGEEFAIILPNTDIEEARGVSERFRKMVAGHQFVYNTSQFHITFSVGIASYGSAAGKSAIDLVEVSDRALYQAKGSGRNRVVVWCSGN